MKTQILILLCILPGFVKSQIKENEQMTSIEIEYFKRCLLNRQYLLDLMQLPEYREKHHFRDEKMAENINWLIQVYAPKQKYILWGADIHLSKNAQWESLGAEWEANQSMVEQLINTYQYQLFSLGIKPLKTLEKPLKSKFKQSKAPYFYVDLQNKGGDFHSLSTEHDGLIICKKTKSIEAFRIKK